MGYSQRYSQPITCGKRIQEANGYGFLVELQSHSSSAWYYIDTPRANIGAGCRLGIFTEDTNTVPQMEQISDMTGMLQCSDVEIKKLRLKGGSEWEAACLSDMIGVGPK
ncbi:hypothetical protein Btru_002011 [Bulinus truncatus]|nr:hypothetical protein Btru_002011 [Bulinus truncatus]